MPKQIHIFIFFTAAYFLSYFYRSANAVLAPDLSAELSLGAEQLGFMTSLFFAAFAAIQIPLGIGLDRWGPRWVTPGLMFVGVIGSVIFAWAPSFAILALGRALIGVGMAGILMGSLKVFSRWYPLERFATVSGLLVGIGSSGALIAATPLAWLNRIIGWRAVFLGGAVVIAAVAFAIILWTRNTPPGVSWREERQKNKGNMKAIFADIRFWRIAPYTLFATGTLLAFQGLWGGPYLFDVLRLTEIEVGNVLLFMGIGTTLGFAFSGWLADQFGLMQVVIIAGTLFIVTQFVLIIQPTLFIVSAVYVIFGFTGAFNILLLSHIRRLFPAEMTGQAVSAVNLFGIGGTFLVQWLLGIIIGSFAQDAAGHYPPQAYVAALLFTAIGGGLTLAWYVPLGRASRQKRVEQTG